MREFAYRSAYEQLLTPDIVGLLTAIHELNGRQSVFMVSEKNAFVSLTETAKVQSITASNFIDDIFTADERLRKIAQNKAVLKSSSECQIAGYRDALAMIDENYDYLPLTQRNILELHGVLYKYSKSSFAGSFKSKDNIIPESSFVGERVYFTPTAASEVPECITRICAAYDDAVNEQELDPLLAIPMVILDFLCVRPFNDGNGRMSRLLTLLLLYRAGYEVCRYISIEKLMADSKTSYYEALQESSYGWSEGENDYMPFVRYLLEIVVSAYENFSRRSGLLVNGSASKPDRVREIVKEKLGNVTIAQIAKQNPDISKITIQRAIKNMLDNNEIIKIGGGRYTAYAWNRED